MCLSFNLSDLYLSSLLELPQPVFLTLFFFFISVSKSLRHFRIFWSSSVLGWWHGTGVASLISVPSVLARSDSDRCFRMILTHFAKIKKKKENPVEGKTKNKHEIKTICTHHEKAYMELKCSIEANMYDAHFRCACLHVLIFISWIKRHPLAFKSRIYLIGLLVCLYSNNNWEKWCVPRHTLN